MNPLLFTSHFSTFTQAKPSITDDELTRCAPSLVGTYRVCHTEQRDVGSSRLNEIFNHIFITDGGCNICKEHYRSLQDSVAHLYRLI